MEAVEPAAAAGAVWDAVEDFANAQQERCVSYAALMDAAAATPGVVQQWGRTSPYAHLLQRSNGTHLELYRSSAPDDTGAPLRTVVAVHLEHMGGMVAAKLCSLATPRAVGGFLAELRCLKRLNGRWGLSYDWRLQRGVIISKLFDGGDFASLIDRAVVQAWQCGERIRPHLLLRPLADVGQEVYEFNSCERHAWIDGKSSNVALRQQGPAGMIDVGSALPHGPARREDMAGTCNNHDPHSMCERQVTAQSDVSGLGVMTMDVIVGRPANNGGLTADGEGYKPLIFIFRMIRDFVNTHSCDELLDLDMPVSNLLGIEPSLALVGLLLVALLICPDNTMKLTLQEAAAAQRALARAQELYDNRQDGPGGVPFLAHFYLLLAQLCAFIGKRRPGLPDSPSVSRGGAAVLGEAGLAVVRELYTSCIASFNTAIRSAAPYCTRQGATTAEAWEFCTRELYLGEGQLPRVYHPALHPQQFDAMWAFEERDRAHWLTEHTILGIQNRFHSIFFSRQMYAAYQAFDGMLAEPLQQWLNSLLAPTVECAEAHVGHLLPPPAGASRTLTLAASLACGSRHARTRSPLCEQLQQMTLAERSSSGSEASSGMDDAHGDGDSQLHLGGEEEEQREEAESTAASGGGGMDSPGSSEAADREQPEPEAEDGPAALTGSAGFNQLQPVRAAAPPKSFKVDLAELRGLFAAEGLSLEGTVYLDAAMERLDRHPQMLAMEAAPAYSGTRGSTNRSAAAGLPAVAAVDFTSMVQSPDLLRNALALPKPVFCAASFYSTCSSIAYDWVDRHAVLAAAAMLQRMPAAARSRLGRRVWLVADVYGSALSLQQERLAGPSSSSSSHAGALALLPPVAAEESRAHALQFILTLQGGSSEVTSSANPPARRGRGGGGRRGAAAAAAAADAASNGQRWLEAAADCVAAQGVRRPYGPVNLSCGWAPLWALLREQGLDACPQLGTAWRSLVLRVLACPERIQRHGRLYLCLQDPSSAEAEFLPLPAFCPSK